MATETAQLKEVLSHPQFKMNAAATIKDHVKNMLAAEIKAKGGMPSAKAIQDKKRKEKKQNALKKGGRSGGGSKQQGPKGGGSKGASAKSPAAGRGNAKAALFALAKPAGGHRADGMPSRPLGKIGKGGRMSKSTRKGRMGAAAGTAK